MPEVGILVRDLSEPQRACLNGAVRSIVFGMVVAREFEDDVVKSTVRSLISKGLLTRVGDGHLVVTELGLKVSIWLLAGEEEE